MDRVTFGLIGTGGIAQSQHLPNIPRAPHIRLKTICDRRADVLASVQKKYEVLSAVTDADELLADPEITAVIVATREDAQAPLTIRALEAGKHVYVEKPLADTAEKCRGVVEAQGRTGGHVAVGFNRRFAPAYRTAKEIVDADGGPKNMYYRISDNYSRGWGRGNPPRGARDPRGLPRLRHPALVHGLPHCVDLLRRLAP